MTLELTALELATAAPVEGAIWTLGTVMPKIAFCTIERQWHSGRKSMGGGALHLFDGTLHLIVVLVSRYSLGSQTAHFY